MFCTNMKRVIKFYLITVKCFLTLETERSETDRQRRRCRSGTGTYVYAVYKYIHSIALLRAVVKTTARTSLALTDNGIGDRGGTTLAKALETNTELTF